MVKCVFFVDNKCKNNDDIHCDKNICCKLCPDRESGKCEIYCVAWEWE